MPRNSRRNSRSRGRGRPTYRRRRRNRSVSPVLVTAGVLVAVGAVVGFTRFSNQPPPPPAAAAAEVTVPPVVVGYIVDPSGSNGGAQAANADIVELADLVESWPGPAPEKGQAGPARPGLDLTVRQVAQNSFGSGAAVADMTVDGLPAAPVPPDGKNITAEAQYLDDFNAYRGSWQAASRHAQAAAERLRRANVTSEVSEVAGALSATAEVLSETGGDRRIIFISDLEQAGAAAEVDGDLSDIELTVFQRCDQGAKPGSTDLPLNCDG